MGGRPAVYKLPNPLIYRLDDPRYTIYHRAALGGLAATVYRWNEKPQLAPQGVRGRVEPKCVEIAWDADDPALTDQEVVRRMLAASFRLTENKLIDLPGQAIPADRDDLRLAIHTGLCGTFLQHPKMRPGEKQPRTLTFREEGAEEEYRLTYKAVHEYAHQKAQGTGLLDAKLNGTLPAAATIPQSVVPGAMSGSVGLEGAPDEVLLLLYLMVGSAVFLLRSRSHPEKAQYAVVAPDVTDLARYAKSLTAIAARGGGIRRFVNTYLGRVVGGAEEAALRFLIDLHADALTQTFERCVAGCLVVAMGKVAWDKNQINRSQVVRVKADYPELGVFKAAQQHFNRARIIKTADGESFAVPPSPLPELIAANLAAERHWCARFIGLCREQKDFTQLTFQRKGLIAMNQAVRDADDKMVIAAFHEAWRLTMGALGERAGKDSLDFARLVEVERERIRNAVLRAKTADALAGWFLRFCTDATKGASLSVVRQKADRIREFIFNPRNFERFQNLCLFALVSYAGEDIKANPELEGESQA